MPLIRKGGGRKQYARGAQLVLEGRLTALQRLAARVRRGERLQLVCACKVHTLNSCHGDVIVDWVRGRLRPE